MPEDVIAVDLGGTHMRTAVVTPEGSVRWHESIETPKEAPHPDELFRLMTSARERSGAHTAVVGLPGRVNYRLGTLEYAPHLPQAWLEDLSASTLAERTGLRVHTGNDAELAAAGEATFGAGRGCSDVIYITLSTGIGAGVVQNGRLVHGTRSMPEPGHTIVDMDGFEAGDDCYMEDFASGTALGRRAQEAGSGHTGADVLDGLKRGDPRSQELWAGSLRIIRMAVFNMAMWFSPEVMVIGGGVGLNAPGLVESLRSWLEEHPPPGLPPLRVERAALGDDAGLVGAAAWARMFAEDDA
ncbi:MAG: ROK family protein [Candidatus Dormibacteria bacterium]